MMRCRYNCVVFLLASLTEFVFIDVQSWMIFRLAEIPRWKKTRRNDPRETRKAKITIEKKVYILLHRLTFSTFFLQIYLLSDIVKGELASELNCYSFFIFADYCSTLCLYKLVCILFSFYSIILCLVLCSRPSQILASFKCM